VPRVHALLKLLLIVSAAIFCWAIIGRLAWLAQSESISETSKKLQSIKVVNDPSVDLPYDVPERVQPLLKQFKSQIRELISSALEKLGPDATPDALRDSMIQELNRADVIAGHGKRDSKEDYDMYGFVQDVGVERPAGKLDLLEVVTTLGIPCGADSSPYVFQKKGGGWMLALRHEANGYKQVEGALGGFGYSISADKKS
jgi:hypothetical protein